MTGLSPLERDIIQLLTRHIARNEEVSLTVLADEAHVAKSTVVKAVQKLGYGGFGELTYNIRFNAQTAGGLLPRHLVEGNLEEDVERLARLLRSCRGKRNVLFSGDRRLGGVLAHYMCRKLALFGVFAIASYDYLMVKGSGLPCGAAMFFFHEELPGRREAGQPEGYGEGMLRAAREAGFKIAVFSNSEERSVEVDTDYLFAIPRDASLGIDLYVPKVLMVFEMALARMSAEEAMVHESE